MPFDARGYWDSRLSSRWTLGGTGHLGYSTSYNRWLYRRKRHVLRRVLRPLPPGVALDVGSGIGWVIEQLADRRWSVSGCDIGPGVVERLRAQLPGVPIALVDVGRQPLPAEDAGVDLVTALDVAYHVVDDAGFAHLLREVARVLRPGGRLLVSDGFGDADVSPAEHVRFRSAQTWRRHADAAGLEVDQVVPYFRWLSRDPAASRLRHLPQGARGALEFAADSVLPREPWMRLAVLRRL